MTVLAEYRVDMERRGLTPRTVYSFMTSLRSFDRAMPGGILTSTEEDVQRFLDARRLSARTRYSWLSCLHGFYRWAMRRELATSDPTVEIVRPKLRRTLPRPITTADLVVAISMAEVDMRAWLTLFAFAGLRCAEVSTLCADDVLVDAGRLRVIGKGNRERMVPMHAEVITALHAHGLPRTGPVFRRPRGGPWPPAMVSRRVSVYLAGLNIDARAHQLRHWFGTRTYAACHDIRVVQELLGHSSPTTTAIYTAFSYTEAEAAVAALSIGA